MSRNHAKHLMCIDSFNHNLRILGRLICHKDCSNLIRYDQRNRSCHFPSELTPAWWYFLPSVRRMCADLQWLGLTANGSDCVASEHLEALISICVSWIQAQSRDQRLPDMAPPVLLVSDVPEDFRSVI